MHLHSFQKNCVRSSEGNEDMQKFDTDIIFFLFHFYFKGKVQNKNEIKNETKTNSCLHFPVRPRVKDIVAKQHL